MQNDENAGPVGKLQVLLMLRSAKPHKSWRTYQQSTLRDNDKAIISYRYTSYSRMSTNNKTIKKCAFGGQELHTYQGESLTGDRLSHFQTGSNNGDRLFENF